MVPIVDEAPGALTEQARLAPPESLSPAEKKIFLALVECRPPEYFGLQHLPILEQYCGHKERADSLKRQISSAKRKDTPESIIKFRGLQKAMASETRALIALSKSLRLAHSAHRKSEKLPGGTPVAGSSFPWTRPANQPLTAAVVIGWIEEHCRIPEGKQVGKPVKLTKHQKKWLSRIYDSPTRVFILTMGRKNAKTALISFIVLVHLCGPGALRNSQLYSTAQSRDQAAIVFGYASKCVRMSPSLGPVVGVRDTAKQLYCPGLGTLYRALSADVPTAFGLSPALVVHDELGQVRGPRSELYEALETAGGAQESPLSIIISTQAPTDADLLSVLIDDALTGADPMAKVEIYAADPDLDPFSVKAIRQANPHFEDFMNQEEVLRQAADAKRMPSREAGFRNLVLNQRVESKAAFVSRSVWIENGEKPHPLEGQQVYGGLDLASVSDLCALVLETPAGDVHPTFWLPEEGLAEKSRGDRVPYDKWKEQGFLLTTPGRSVEYEFIAEHLRGVFDRLDVQAIAFDRYNMKFLKPWLVAAHFTDAELEKFIDFGQGFVSMSPAIRTVESKLLAKKYRHGNHPVLTMCAANARIVEDPAQNRKFTKGKATGRIDGMVALAMAEGVLSTPAAASKPKEFKMLFV